MAKYALDENFIINLTSAIINRTDKLYQSKSSTTDISNRLAIIEQKIANGDIGSGGSGGGGGSIIKVNGTVLSPDSNGIINITIPTSLSQLVNDTDFVTSSECVTKITQVTNEMHVVTTDNIPIKTIKVNGKVVNPVNGSVDIVIPEGSGGSSGTDVIGTTLTINNTTLTPDSEGKYNINIPTKTSQLTNDSDFRNGTQVNDSINTAIGAVVAASY